MSKLIEKHLSIDLLTNTLREIKNNTPTKKNKSPALNKSKLDFLNQTKNKNKNNYTEEINYATKYQVTNLYATSLDGTMVPLTLVEKATNITLKLVKPVLIIGYGAYGVCVPVYYDPQYTVLLEKGWILAFAHCRGGGELGVSWHHQGKGGMKKNTFHDFIACVRYLLDNEVTIPSKLCAMGGSAGGLIMGVMLNEYPEYFAGVIMR